MLVLHVDAMYSEAFGEVLDTPMEARGNYVNDINSLVDMFKELIPDHTAETRTNPFQGVNGVDIDSGDMRTRCPWIFIRRVAEGRSAPVGYNNQQVWQEHLMRGLELLE